MGTCTGTAFRGRSAHQDVDPAALRAPSRPMRPGARTHARGPTVAGGVGPAATPARGGAVTGPANGSGPGSGSRGRPSHRPDGAVAERPRQAVTRGHEDARVWLTHLVEYCA